MPKPFVPFKPVSLSKNQANWRGDLRARVGVNGEKLWEIILDIAQGKPLVCTLPDGREKVTIPDAGTRLKAAIHLGESLFGKAVSQIEQKQAEDSANEIKAMGDLELEARARNILARGLQKLDARLAANGTDIACEEDAEDVQEAGQAVGVGGCGEG